MGREAVSATVIEKIKAELGQGRTARAVDVAYSELDDMLLGGACDDAREVMRLMVVHELPLSVVLSALTISLPWRIATGSARQELAQYALAKAIENYGADEGEVTLRGLL